MVIIVIRRVYIYIYIEYYNYCIRKTVIQRGDSVAALKTGGGRVQLFTRGRKNVFHSSDNGRGGRTTPKTLLFTQTKTPKTTRAPTPRFVGRRVDGPPKTVRPTHPTER